MRRYLHITRLFWSASVAAEAEYRLNFAVSALAAAAGLAVSVFSMFLLFRQTDTLGGWRWNEAMMVMGVFTILEGLASALLTPNLGRIVQHVQSGTLDFVLLKPVDAQFWLSTRNLSLGGLPDVVLGLAMTGYSAWSVGVGPAELARGALPMAISIVILYCLWFMLATTSIWFVKIYNVTEVLRSLLEAGRLPIGAYPAAYRFFFTFVIPVAFLTTVPAEMILGRAGAGWVLGSAAVAVTMAILSRWFWRFAMRYYTSASS